MNKEDITILAQILSSMKDAVSELEKAQKNKDLERINLAKKEILTLKDQMNKKL
jgi:hypothetical protein